jgi:hypothetical protein
MGLRASKGIRKSPGAFVGTFRKILLILPSRRLRVILMGLLGYETVLRLPQKYSYPQG